MRYGIISDIHANLEALQSVLRLLKNQEVDRYLCCGDIVGYGPNPNECVDIVRSLRPAAIVAGNHDWAACGMKDISRFNPDAAKALLWTAKVLSPDNALYLSELPKSAGLPGITLVHGSPRGPIDEYVLEDEQYDENFPYLTAPLTIVGHTHVPRLFVRGLGMSLRSNVPAILHEGEKYIVNPGSVGQPRDSSPKASCAVLDVEKSELSVHRVDYAAAQTQEKMRACRLPAFLIERLSWGR